jgi:chitin deacetylase
VKRAVVLLSLLALLFLAWGAWSISDSRGFQLFGDIVDRVETASPVVALTFDDGPTPAGADSILAILERQDVRATFFFTGAEMDQNPALAPRFVRAGHELGNHSWSHRRMLLRSPSFIRSEIERTDSLIRAAGHRGEIHFRPPYGKKLVGLPWYLDRTGRTTIMWDVEPDSYADVAASAEGIVAHVRERARPGSIVILHVMYPSRGESLRAVEGAIDGLRGRGFRFVTVSELLRAR